MPVSEHIAFVQAGGLEAGHLLPVPREVLDCAACLECGKFLVMRP